MLTDANYALQQIDKAKFALLDGAGAHSLSTRRAFDCLTRACDALDRIKEQAEQAEYDSMEDTIITESAN